MANTQQTEAFIEKILHSTRGAFELFGMYLGVKLGYYRAQRERRGQLTGAGGADGNLRTLRQGMVGAAGDLRNYQSR